MTNKTNFRPVFSLTFLGLCTLFSLAGALSTTFYEFFGARLDPEYFWQYFTYVFMHGSPSQPIFILIHLVLNAIIFMNVGVMAERFIGIKHMVFLSLLAFTGYYLTQKVTGILVNGASGVIWAYSAVFFEIARKNRRLESDSELQSLDETARMWLFIMWVVVTIFMGFVPYLFGSDKPLWITFIFGNIFHGQAVVIGLLYMWVTKPLSDNLSAEQSLG